MGIPKLGPVIAIDGPAGSGKSSATKRLAEALGFVHVDTGALYRAVALLVRETGKGDVAAADVARSAHLEFKREADKSFAAHAWLVKDGRQYLEPATSTFATFQVITTFPERAATPA